MGQDHASLDLTGETDQNWLNEEPPQPVDERLDDDERDELRARVMGEAAQDDADDPADDPFAKAGDYTAVDDALFEAYEKSVWWNLGEDSPDLAKAPRVWRTDDEVPEAVRDLIAEVIETTDWRWADFESLSPREADELVALLEEKLTQPQGWSVGSLAEDIDDRFDLGEEVALGMARDTTSQVLNTTREEAYEEMAGSETFEYKWLNPQDWRTTPVCREVIAEIEDRGGAVPMPVLKQILRAKALKYEHTREGGGTPDRVEQFCPHWQCRSTFVREAPSAQ